MLNDLRLPDVTRTASGRDSVTIIITDEAGPLAALSTVRKVRAGLELTVGYLPAEAVKHHPVGMTSSLGAGRAGDGDKEALEEEPRGAEGARDFGSEEDEVDEHASELDEFEDVRVEEKPFLGVWKVIGEVVSGLIGLVDMEDVVSAETGELEALPRSVA